MQSDVDEGMGHLRAGRWNEGAACMERALATAPGFAEAWGNLGYALRELGRFDEAREALERAVRLKPELAEAWNLLGLVEQARNRHDAAHPCFTRAIEMLPRFAYAWMNRANSDFELGRREEALAGYSRSLALDPNHPATHCNVGYVHQTAGEIDAAMAHYREAVRIDPASATCHRYLSNALFLEGRFEEAWREYGWRQSRQDHLAQLGQAGIAYGVPQRSAIGNRRITIVGEQGLGDNLFFLRFVPALRALGASLAYAGDPRLHGMLARTGHFEALLQRAPMGRIPDEPAILAGDLALLFPEHAGLAPAPPLALTPDASRVARARERLRAFGPPPHIALTWRAGAPQAGFARLVKEISPRMLGQSLRGIRATWIAVQRDPRPDEMAALADGLGSAVHDQGVVNADLEDALALMAAVGDYVGVSNTNMHLRAGVSPAGRVLVPFPEWRWMARGVSPWFPGFSVYRHARGPGWAPALQRLAADLQGAPR